MCAADLSLRHYTGDCCSQRCYDRRRNAAKPVKVYEPQPCAFCSKLFTPDRRTARFCSSACKTALNHRTLRHEKVCLNCKTPFSTGNHRAKYCSISCGLTGSTGDITKILSCVDCGATFEFCGRTSAKRCPSCYRGVRRRTVQKWEAKVGKAQGRNYSAIAYAHYGEACVVCQVTEPLEVHHIDGVRSNNDVSNLVPLCANHHGLTHNRARQCGDLREGLFKVWPEGRTKIAELSGDLQATGQSEPKAGDTQSGATTTGQGEQGATPVPINPHEAATPNG